MRKTIFAAALTGLAASAGATPWTDFGPRAMGMGGAYTAIAQGPEASYYNPAGLGQLYNTSGLSIPVGARGEFTGTVLQGAKDLNQLNNDCQAGLSDCTLANAQNAVNNLNKPGNGVLVDVGGGVAVKIKRAVLFVNDIADVGAMPRADFTFGACPGAACVSSNNSKLIVRGGNFTEVGIGYGHEVRETGLVLGANLKGIVGRVGYTEIGVAANDASHGTASKFKDNSRSSIQPGVDLGLLWDMRETFSSLPMRPRLGLVGRNLNDPKFKNPDVSAAFPAAGLPSKYGLDGQVRAGAALSPFKFWNLALDVDVTNNRTPLDGYKSRYMSAGTEINVFNRTWLNIPLRVGIQKNLSNTASGATYTGGFGLNFVHIIVDVAGMVSAKSTTIQSQGKNSKVPNNFGAAARFAFLFGGTDEGGRSESHKVR